MAIPGEQTPQSPYPNAETMFPGAVAAVHALAGKEEEMALDALERMGKSLGQIDVTGKLPEQAKKTLDEANSIFKMALDVNLDEIAKRGAPTPVEIDALKKLGGDVAVNAFGLLHDPSKQAEAKESINNAVTKTLNEASNGVIAQELQQAAANFNTSLYKNAEAAFPGAATNIHALGGPKELEVLKALDNMASVFPKLDGLEKFCAAEGENFAALAQKGNLTDVQKTALKTLGGDDAVLAFGLMRLGFETGNADAVKNGAKKLVGDIATTQGQNYDSHHGKHAELAPQSRDTFQATNTNDITLHPSPDKSTPAGRSATV